MQKISQSKRPHSKNGNSYLLALNEVNNNEAVKLKKVNLNKVAIQDIKTLLVISSSLVSFS